MLSTIQKFDRRICHHLILLLALLLVIVLRFPNFFEPYWYGDEGIYLTLGTAMRHGERLYTDIIDHKTPMIYYLAMVPTQLDFRILNVAASLVTVTLFYFFVRKLVKSKLAVSLATFFFVLITCLPWFEGYIPNGELFVMFFLFIGATFFSRTELFNNFIADEKVTSHIAAKQLILFLISGIFFGLGVLTKVPALFDVLAFLFIFWLLFNQTIWQIKTKPKLLWSVIVAGGVCFAGVLLPILLSIVYFVARGSGQAYLDYGLLYNFHYVESYVPSFPAAALNILFKLPVKAGLLVLLLLATTATQKIFSGRFRFIFGWVCLAFFASLLSNRPYPHYYLQIMPPLALLLAYVTQVVVDFSKKTMHWQKLAELIVSGLFVAVFIATLLLLHVGLYSTSGYYLQFWKLATRQITPTQYRDSFNSYDADNYKAAAIIRTSQEQRIFVWGTDPMLYALSGKSPTGRFTVAFHIYDFHALDETIQDVKKHAPEYIVVMNDEKPFPQLQAYLNQYYMPNAQFQHFVLWKRE